MVQRTVSVGLVANVGNYVVGMERAAEATRKTAAAAVGSEKQLRAQGEAFTKLGTVAMAGGVVAAAGLVLVIKASAEYGAKMAQLQSLSHASAGQMKQLSDAAMSVGTAYGFSATQVADAEIELTKAGIGVKEQLGGALKGALTLAAAGQMDVAQATEITTVAMTQFGLSAAQVPHVADLLSAGADKALGSVGDLGEALKNGGLQAHNMGLTIDDTVGLLSAFANAGILGAEAGTQMRSMFIQLQKPSSQAKKVLDEYGISLSDQSGKFVGITALAGELHDKLGGLTQANRNAALATIFGSHAITGASVLYQDGAKGIAAWIRNVNDSGFASAQAAGKMNSLQGDTQKLSAAFQTDLIKAGSGANDMLRHLVQGATGALDVFGAIPAPLLNVGAGVTAVVAGVGLLGGAALIAVPKIVAFRGALDELGISGKQAAGTFAKGAALTAGIVLLSAGLAGLGQQGTATSQQIEQTGIVASKSFKDLDKLFQSTNALSGAQAGFKNALDFEGLGSSVQKFGSLNGMISGLSATVLHNEGTFDALGQQLAGLAQRSLPAAQQGFAGMVKQYGLNAGQTQKLLGLMPAYRDELVKQAGAAHVSATDQNLLLLAQGKGAVSVKAVAAAQAAAAAAASKQASSLAALTGSGNAATTSMKDLHDALAGLGSTELDARSAARDFQQAIDDATAAARKNGRTLDINTQAGRDNAAALDGIAKNADAAAAAYVQNGGSAKGAAAIISNARGAYIRTAEAMGASKAQANRLADALHLIPKDINSIVRLTDGASGRIAQIRAAMSNLQGTTADVYIKARTVGLTDAQASQIAKNAHFADGGAISGPGPKGKDSVLAWVAPGEHVLTAKDVDKMGGQGAVYAFRSGLNAYADGGAIGDDEHAAASASRALAKANRELAAAKRAQKAADEKAKNASSRAAHIFGKGTAKAKHEASLEAAAARQESAAAKKDVAAAQKAATAAKTARDDANAKVSALKQNREDFVSTQRRATADSPIDPLSYVDQLRSMSRDSNFSSKRQKSYDAAANKYEASLVKLQTAASAAATKLTDLKNSSEQMKSSITSSIAGGYQASNAGAVSQASGWVTRNGIRMQSYSSGVTASSLASYYQGGAADTASFAAQLKALAGRGVNPALVAEIAGYGVAQGAPIAAAILSANGSQLSSINSGYAAIQTNAGTAGSFVADDNYAGLIASAQSASDAITKQIADDGEKLRKLIASAFGLKGYASGTSYATAGMHLVGEKGPELLRFAGGEQVYTAAQTRSYIRGSGSSSTASPQMMRVHVSMPQTMNLIDVDGQVIGRVRTEARDVAVQEIAVDAHYDSVHLGYGGAA